MNNDIFEINNLHYFTSFDLKGHVVTHVMNTVIITTALNVRSILAQPGMRNQH